MRWKGMDTVIFATHLIEYAFVGCKIYGRRELKWITQHDLTFALVKLGLLVFAPLLSTPQKTCLSPSIVAFMDFRSNANLPCLVNLALNV